MGVKRHPKNSEAASVCRTVTRSATTWSGLAVVAMQAIFCGLVLLLATLTCWAKQSNHDSAAWVNPLVGTDAAPLENGQSDRGATFPGAVLPFGMIEWSPDTKLRLSDSGYSYEDSQIVDFSLTHMSGVGCSAYQDFGILPSVGPVTDPASATQTFSHATEEASPGWYAVTLGDGKAETTIRTELTVTQRTGLGRFQFPASRQANFLFKMWSSRLRKEGATAQVVGQNQVEGSITEGRFCGTLGRSHTIYFVARFDRDFASHSSWKKADVAPGSALASGPESGMWVSFDTTKNQVVRLKVAISYVSRDGALANLEAENRGWDIGKVRAAARRAWNQELGTIQIHGGTGSERRTFYTALYHALLFPSLFSDVDGRYLGFDSEVHQTAPGRNEYANFSDWDIYRSQVPLIAWLDPQRTSDMMQSLVDAAQQEGGVLPRWPAANAASGMMGGDSPDPVVAGAYAFGARKFDLHAALDAMVKGATDIGAAPFDGWYVERPRLTEYLQSGYVPLDRSTDSHTCASETLEYALDDFSIAQLAHALGNEGVYRQFLKRSQNWKNVFDTVRLSILPRTREGAFEVTTFEDGFQYGFEEGNAAQYTWMVPFDLEHLVQRMGGREQASKRLDELFQKLNAGASQPYAWMGNEPGAGTPWVYLSLGEPWKTQEVTRRILGTLFNDTPQGLPGNDDMGQMSAWYVWTAMGLYPQYPAIRILDVGSPLFPRVVIHPKDGPKLVIEAPGASSSTPYVQSLKINGRDSERSWFELPRNGRVSLTFRMQAEPSRVWGSEPANAPPSFAPSRSSKY